MRIHLNLPTSEVAGPSSAASSSSSNLTASTISLAPGPLTSMSPNGELLLIELQGSLEIEHQDPAGGQVLGTISFEPGRENRPVLHVSHHRLEGKFVNLIKPLAILEKKTRDSSTTGTTARSGNTSKDPLQQRDDNLLVGVTQTKSSLSKRNRNASSPPPMTPKSLKRSLDFSSSPPRPHPSTRILRHGDTSNHEDEQSVEEDEGEDKDEEDQDQDDHQTAVYYDVVNIIRRKILFSKRPEPIVKLDTAKSA